MRIYSVDTTLLESWSLNRIIYDTDYKYLDYKYLRYGTHARGKPNGFKWVPVYSIPTEFLISPLPPFISYIQSVIILFIGIDRYNL